MYEGPAEPDTHSLTLLMGAHPDCSLTLGSSADDDDACFPEAAENMARPRAQAVSCQRQRTRLASCASDGATCIITSSHALQFKC